MMKSSRFPILVFGLAIAMSWGMQPVSAQGDPIEHLSVERLETRNFEIVMEKSPEPRRPTIKEVGILVERLCAQLDKIFLKYAPHRVAEELERLEKEKAEGKKPPEKSSARSSGKSREVNPDDPDRVIPKCRIFIFNDRRSYTAKCVYDGIEADSDILTEGYGGFFTAKTNSIYMIRSWFVQNTRETILHEATHYYMRNFLPGGGYCYPQWFHEGLAMSYEGHVWSGNKLTIGVQQRIQKFDSPAGALVGLQRFRHYLRRQTENRENKTVGTAPFDDAAFEDSEKATGTKTARKRGKSSQPETPIDPSLIQVFLDNEFTPEKLARDGIVLKNPHEEIAYRYAMYLAFGRYLLAERPEHLGAVMRQIALWEKERGRQFPKQNWFDEAWKIAAADQPVTVEEIGRWVRKNQLPFQWTYGDWQDLGEQIAGKGQDGKISILALRDPQALPKFTVFPKNLTKFQAGVVINYVDNGHFGAVVVDQDGDVLQMQQIAGNWIGAKRIGKASPQPARNSPYGNNVSLQFAVTRQGNMLAVHVNRQIVGTYPKRSNATCGFFLSSTEAIFAY